MGGCDGTPDPRIVREEHANEPPRRADILYVTGRNPADARFLGERFPPPLMFQGAQERSVPATKGCIPRAPDGGHSSQAGMLLDGATVALPDDPPEFRGEDDLGPAPPGAPDRVAAVPPPDAEFVAAVLEVDPVAVVPVVEDDVA